MLFPGLTGSIFKLYNTYPWSIEQTSWDEYPAQQSIFAWPISENYVLEGEIPLRFPVCT